MFCAVSISSCHRAGRKSPSASYYQLYSQFTTKSRGFAVFGSLLVSNSEFLSLFVGLYTLVNRNACAAVTCTSSFMIGATHAIRLIIVRGLILPGTLPKFAQKFAMSEMVRLIEQQRRVLHGNRRWKIMNLTAEDGANINAAQFLNHVQVIYHLLCSQSIFFLIFCNPTFLLCNPFAVSVVHTRTMPTKMDYYFSGQRRFF